MAPLSRLHHLIIGIALFLLLIPWVEARCCYYCDSTIMGNCPNIKITCAEEDNCYTGLAASPGLPTIIIKSCMEARFCGREQHITYEGTNYSLIAFCCHAELCNKDIQFQNSFPTDTATKLSTKAVFMVVFLFLF